MTEDQIRIKHKEMLNNWLRWIIELIKARIAFSCAGTNDLLSLIQVLEYIIIDDHTAFQQKEKAYNKFIKLILEKDGSDHSKSMKSWCFTDHIYDQLQMAFTANAQGADYEIHEAFDQIEGGFPLNEIG